MLVSDALKYLVSLNPNLPLVFSNLSEERTLFVQSFNTALHNNRVVVAGILVDHEPEQTQFLTLPSTTDPLAPTNGPVTGPTNVTYIDEREEKPKRTAKKSTKTTAKRSAGRPKRSK